jgi:hypothetical protein
MVHQAAPEDQAVAGMDGQVERLEQVVQVTLHQQLHLKEITAGMELLVVLLLAAVVVAQAQLVKMALILGLMGAMEAQVLRQALLALA